MAVTPIETDAVEKREECACEQTPANRAPEPAHREPRTAAESFALAESLVHWEDDVTPDEIAIVLDLYRHAIALARAELALPMESNVTESSVEALLELRHKASRLVAQSAGRHSKLRRVRWRRLAPLLVALVFLIAFFSRDAVIDGLDFFDVSRGKPWLASSWESPFGQPRGDLGPFNERFFFHTKLEQSPWLEVDLGRPTPLRRATIINREDCCQERTVPLAIEISSDHQTWHQVARRARVFDVWHPHFDAISGRWVRLRVLRQSILHLKEVTFRSE